MMEPEGGENSPLNPLSKARRIDNICDRFEAAWNAGTRPVIDEFLRDTPPEEQPAVLRELVILDLHYRRHAGETPQPEDYLARFPALDQDWLVRMIATPLAEGSDGDLRTLGITPVDTPPSRRPTSPYSLPGRL